MPTDLHSAAQRVIDLWEKDLFLISDDGVRMVWSSSLKDALADLRSALQQGYCCNSESVSCGLANPLQCATHASRYQNILNLSSSRPPTVHVGRTPKCRQCGKAQTVDGPLCFECNRARSGSALHEPQPKGTIALRTRLRGIAAAIGNDQKYLAGIGADTVRLVLYDAANALQDADERSGSALQQPQPYVCSPMSCGHGSCHLVDVQTGDSCSMCDLIQERDSLRERDSIRFRQVASLAAALHVDTFEQIGQRFAELKRERDELERKAGSALAQPQQPTNEEMIEGDK